ncbi:MAG: phosphatidylglycerol lysyltransferase domain-containing protein [Thermodesulfobacteriota bacterium]
MLEPADFRVYAEYYRHQPHELCEFCLATLIVWANDEYRPKIGTDGRHVFIAGEFYHTRELNHLMLPVGPGPEYTPAELARLADRLGYTAFWFVPDSYIERHGHATVAALFTVSEQTAYADYVYRTRDLAELAGNRYAKKRNLINQFLASGPDLSFDSISPANSGECLDFLAEWCRSRDCDEGLEDSLTCERLAAEKMLRHIDMFDARGLLLRIDGKLCAFAVGSPLTDDMWVLQFQKASEQIKGLYQYFDRECARRLFPAGTVYINKESDMDNPNLAKSKKSYHPCRRVRSFQLQLR